MTDLQATQQLYQQLHLAYTSDEGYFLPPGKFSVDDMLACSYVSFFSQDGNRITHYFTPTGVYWTTLSGRKVDGTPA